MATNRDTYWAAEPESRDVVQRCLDRVHEYRDWLQRTGRAEKMLRAWSAYYGTGPDGTKSTHKLLRGGAQGELVLTSPNVFAILVRQTMRLLTGQRAALKAVSTNGDSAAIAETVLAEALLDYYDRQAQLQEVDNDAVLSGLLFGSGWVVLSWATTLGEEVGVADDGRVLREGDVVARALLPWDVAVDIRDSDATRQWVVFRTTAKRHDLAVQYPHCADEILRGRGVEVKSTSHVFEDVARAWRLEQRVGDEDNVDVWELRHLRTPACPSGRLVRFISADCVLYDSANARVTLDDGGEGRADAGYPYPELLAYEFTPERQVGRADGHTPHFDLLSLQELLDLIVTTVASNVNIGGLLNVWTASEPNFQQLATGFNVIQSPTKPEVLDLLKVPPELMALSQTVQQWMQQLVGVNDVVMGEPQKGMPAQLAALLEAKAVQYHQQGQAAYYRMQERSRTGLLKLLARFARGKRVAQLVGKSGAWALREWSGEELSGVERVIIEPVNPVMKTFAGRVALATELANRYPMTRDEFLAVYTTGNLTQTFDAHKAHLGRLAKEKELLLQGIGLPPVDAQASLEKGEPVFVDDGQPHIRPLLTDRHWTDIPEYLSLLESPEARGDAKLVRAVTEVVQEHLRLWRAMPPDLLQLLGGPPPPPPDMPPPVPGAAPPPAEGKSPKPDMAELAEAVPGGAPEVKLPSPPPNPLTGERPPPQS